MRPMKRRGNRRYYQHHEVLMIRRIRELLYDQGFTISGARNKLQEFAQAERDRRRSDGNDAGESAFPESMLDASDSEWPSSAFGDQSVVEEGRAEVERQRLLGLRRELQEIRELLLLKP